MNNAQSFNDFPFRNMWPSHALKHISGNRIRTNSAVFLNIDQKADDLAPLVLNIYVANSFVSFRLNPNIDEN